MPLTHTRNFRVRYYECDAYGHLNNVNYLRYMQETAFDAAAAAGYDMQRLSQLNRQWWVRETQIEYLRPVIYNDSVEVCTWVADFRHVSSRRMYEVRKNGETELVARGWTDWIYIDTETGRPVEIDVAVARSFFPEGLPDHFPTRSPFPTPPAPPAGRFDAHRKVRWPEIDSAQHVNNTVYLEYIEDAGMEVIEHFGWPLERMASENFALLIRQHHIQYRLPARLGDELVISTWVSDVRRSSAVRHYTIHRQGEDTILVRVQSLGVWVSLETGRPIRIPGGLLADFAPNITAVDGKGPGAEGV